MSLPIAVLATLALVAPDDVRARIQALYDEERFEEALALTINEYRASGGEAIFLYAGASAASALGDCHQAVDLYQRALTSTDSADAKQAIVEELESCRDRLAAGTPEAELPATFPLRWGDAERALGDCEAATTSYRRALRRQATEAERTAAELGLDACRPRASDPPAPIVVGEKKPVVAARRRDPWTPALMTTGGVTLALGLGLVGGAVVDARRAREADEARFQTQTERANRLLAAGIVVSSIGVAVLTAATIRLIVRRRR